MKLISFEIGPYRNVLATGEVQADQRVTVLVGKNESGKTNLLHALHALNPANGIRRFATSDYPRWLQKKHQASGEFDRARPVQATFQLEPEDINAVTIKFGEEVLLQDTFCVYRKYGSDSYTATNPECNSSRAIRNAQAASVGLALGVDLDEVRHQLTDESALTTDDNEPTGAATRAKEQLERLTAAFGSSSSVADAVTALLELRMPRFFYFDDLDQLPGTTDTGPLLAAIAGGSAADLNGPQRTALALLRMGQANADIVVNDYVPRKAELEAVGAELTAEVLDYWKQNTHLSLEIDINPVEESTPQGQQIVRRELKLDVKDDRHRFTNSLDARSSGFRWFVSFIAAFMEFQTDSQVIVLLDEPGLSLHARAQADFLRFMNERVANRHQVLYTTHSPFMVEPARLERVRVVEDTGPITGARVTSADGASADPDTLFPLQAALGYDIAQNIFVGADNLAVEGLSDFTFLTVLSEYLGAVGRTQLDTRWRVLPTGGATNIPTFVSLVGQALDITVLVDGAEAAGQKIQNLVRSGLLKSTRLITPEVAASVKHAETEDLFTTDDYLKLYNLAFSETLDSSALPGADRIVKRIERAIGRPFDHNKPAHYLLHHRDELMPSLSERTLTQFESLFERINATLSGSIG